MIRYALITGAGKRFVHAFLDEQEVMPTTVVHVLSENNLIAVVRNRVAYLECLLRRMFKSFHSAQPLIEEFDKCVKPGGLNSLSDWLRTLNLDLLVVYKIGKLSGDMIAVARHGAINLHPSLLPKYRGGNPLLWMAMNYDLEGGCTLIKINEHFDKGALVSQQAFPIHPGQSEDEIEQVAIHQIGSRLVKQALKQCSLHGQLPCEPQPSHSPTPFASQLDEEQAFDLIDWQNWEIGRTWHYLRSSDFWVHRLKAAGIGTLWHRYSIGGYEACDVPGEGEPGDLVQAGKSLYFLHPQGKIFVKKSVSMKQMVKNTVVNRGRSKKHDKG